MRFRKTKLIATIGPACDDPKILHTMFEAGANVVRLNLSHGTPEDQVRLLNRVREVASAGNFNIAVMADTKGIEIRTGTVSGGAAVLEQGDRFTLFEKQTEGGPSGVSVTYPGLAQRLSLGDEVLLDDGKIALRVERLTPGEVDCRVECGGTLRNRKGVSFPEIDLIRSAFGPTSSTISISPSRTASSTSLRRSCNPLKTSRTFARI